LLNNTERRKSESFELIKTVAKNGTLNTAQKILAVAIENRNISLDEASALLYRSQLYKTLEDEKTKVWRLGYPLLYDMLEEELATGKITFPEEQ